MSAALLLTADGTGLALGLVALAAAIGIARLVDTVHLRGAAERRQAQVLQVCELLVSELRAGQPPLAALDHCAGVWAEFESVAVAGRLGADVPDAFRRLACLSGAGDLRHVAAAWQVSQASGAGLSVALAQVADSVRQGEATRRLVRSELASAQTTARLVAALPLAVLFMGSGVGGDPWGFLLETAAGLTCLAAGLLLLFLGLTWMERIASSVVAR